MNKNNKVNILKRDDIDEFLSSVFHHGDVMDELHHDSNDEELPIMKYFSRITDAEDSAFQIEEEDGYCFRSLGCTILNNAGSFLKKKSYSIKVSYYFN